MIGEYGVDSYCCCKKLGQRKTGRQEFWNKRVSCVLSAMLKRKVQMRRSKQGLVNSSQAHTHGTAMRKVISTLRATPDSSSIIRNGCRKRSYPPPFLWIISAKLSPRANMSGNSTTIKEYMIHQGKVAGGYPKISPTTIRFGSKIGTRLP